MIHVCYAMNDTSGIYSNFIGTSMLSIFENTCEKIRIHILHDNTLSNPNRQKLVEIVRKYDQQVIFYNVEDLAEKWQAEFSKIDNRYNIADFYRYFIPVLLPDDISKVIYLDAGTIVNLDIKRLWDTDIENFPIAVFDGNDVSITILNLDQLRDESKYGRDFMIKSGIKILSEYASDNKPLNQKILSDMFTNNMGGLPSELKQSADSRLVHYDISQEILLCADNSTSIAFWKYFIKTPFCKIESFENIFSDRLRIFNAEKKSTADHFSNIQKILRLTITRPRVFFMNPADADEVNKTFGLTKKTIGINSESPTSEDSLIDCMRSTNLNSKQKSIYYLHLNLDRYSEIKSKLESEGFIEYEDFFNSKVMF